MKNTYLVQINAFHFLFNIESNPLQNILMVLGNKAPKENVFNEIVGTREQYRGSNHRAVCNEKYKLHLE